MTAAEQKTINDLSTIVKDMRDNNANFAKAIKEQVEAINKKVDEKHTPIYFEKDILSNVQSAMNKAIGDALTGYQSPLAKLTHEVINSRTDELKGIISESFDTVIRTTDFKQSIVNGFSHKIARNIISNNDGLFDKVSNEMKQDVRFKAKIHLAVSNVIEEILNDKKEGAK